MYQMSQWGWPCGCGVGCTPELLKDETYGLWRFERKLALEWKLDIRHRRFDWLRQRYPQMFLRLEDQNSVDECEWKSLGYRREDERNWWVRMQDMYSGLG